MHFGSNKAKRRISKRVSQENKARQIFQKRTFLYTLMIHIGKISIFKNCNSGIWVFWGFKAHFLVKLVLLKKRVIALYPKFFDVFPYLFTNFNSFFRKLLVDPNIFRILFLNFLKYTLSFLNEKTLQLLFCMSTWFYLLCKWALTIFKFLLLYVSFRMSSVSVFFNPFCISQSRQMWSWHALSSPLILLIYLLPPSLPRYFVNDYWWWC